MAEENTILASPWRGGFSTWKNFIPGYALMTGGGARSHKVFQDATLTDPQTAYAIENSVCAGLLAAAIAGSVRLVQHINRVSEISEDDNPEKGIAKQVGTTFNVSLNDKATTKQKAKEKAALQKTAEIKPGPDEALMPGPTEITKNTLMVGVPLSVALLAAAGAWKGVDYLADKRRNSLLDKAIAGKSDTIKTLMKARARIAKGNISEDEVNAALASVDNLDNYVKTAAEGDDSKPLVKEDWPYEKTRQFLTSYGLVAMALMGAAALGSYEYFKASDKNNIRYKAMKKGLKEYAKNKALSTPINIVPTDAEDYFGDIDDGTQAPSTAREMAEVPQTSKPIDVTL